MSKKRTAAELQREFDNIAPELALAIKALIRGYMPAELRSKPFNVSIEVERDKATPRRATAKKVE